MPSGLLLLSLEDEVPLSRAFCWHPDGTQFATPGPAGSLCIRDATDGRTIQTLKCRQEGWQHSAWSPDGRWIAAVYWGYPNSKSSFSIWDNRNGRIGHRSTARLTHPAGLFWSPDGTRLAITGEETIILDTTVSGADKPPTTPFTAIETPLFHDKNLITFSGFAWSPDGKQFAVSTKTSAFVFNLETGQKSFRSARISRTLHRLPGLPVET